jgi:hypothetical protein
MWKLLLHHLLHWIRSGSEEKPAPGEAPVPPEIAAEAIRDEIEILSEQRLRLWRAAGAYEEFEFSELAESSLLLVRAVEERIDSLGRSTQA